MFRTLNGAAALGTSGSPLVDCFAMVGAMRRHPAQAVNLFARAYRADRCLALRLLLWLRDARQGAGERQGFRNIFHWLEREHSADAEALLRSGILTSLGRWDDVLCVAREDSWAIVAEKVGQALLAQDRLCAKWMPRRGPVAAQLARRLGLTSAEWRKILARSSDTVEQQLSAGHHDAIQYRAVPSVAAARYKRTFRRYGGDRYQDYLANVKAGRSVMHADVVFPHDVLKASLIDDEAATVQWAKLPRPAIAGEALVICDVSGSMFVPVSGKTAAIHICVALGLLLAESLPEPFRNQVLTFSGSPEWLTVPEGTLAHRVKKLMGAHWGMTTNVERALDLVLEKAISAQAPMPKSLIIFSDMEFDCASDSGKTNFEQAKRKFERAGYELPVIVFWNLDARSGAVPARNETGVLLVSGYSPRIAETLLSGDFENLDSDRLMRAVLGNTRYDVPGLTIV